MRIPLSWLREHVAIPESTSARDVAAALIRAGLEVERVEQVGGDVTGVVLGRVTEITELTEFAKPIRFCRLDVGEDVPRGIVCGAQNFAVGDLVAVAVPGAVLPGGFAISARKTYGQLSDGMICSSRELGAGDEHDGILVLDPALVGDAPLGTDAVTLLALREEVLDIAVTPDRGYCLSVRGVAREVATAFGVPFHDPAVRAVPVPDGAGWPVRVDDPGACARYVARRVTGMDPAATSPAWLQRRLTLAGMRPVSLAVDVTNHVLLELGQPLHAFDAALLHGAIVVRRAGPGERLKTLDGADRTLLESDLVIADDRGPVALAGVMGGQTVEVSATTTDVVLESAHFAAAPIAATSRRLKLASEASRRYERGVDLDLAAAAAEAAVDLLVRLGGATAAEGVTDVDSRAPRGTVALPLGEPGRLAGREYAPEVVRGRLVDVGCTVTGTDPLVVTPPSWRPDLVGTADLVEEVLRLEGYDTLPSVLPRARPGLGLTPAQKARRRIGTALAESGLVETPTAPWIAATALDALSLGAHDPRRATVALLNPMAETEPLLRSTLLPGLFGALLRNVGRGNLDVALFELGVVFRASGSAPVAPPPAGSPPAPDVLASLDATLPAQPWHVAVVAAGMREPAGWWGPGRAADHSDAVAALRRVAAAARVEVTVGAADSAPFHPGRCAALSVDGVVVGHAGELHPRVVAAYGLPARTVAGELDLSALLGAAVDVVAGPSVGTYPPATQDVALVVPDEVPAAEVDAALRAGAGPLLESLRLFDVYTGAPVPAGSRSLAYTLTLRAGDRTLTADEASTVRAAAVAEASRRTGAVQRG